MRIGGVGRDEYAGGHVVTIDCGGADRYRNNAVGTIASGLGGIGLVLDGGGNDRYRQPGLDGFAYGAAGGAGVLVDHGGDDAYAAPPEWHELLGASLGYFSGPVLASSEVNGLAALLDLAGNDRYACDGPVRQPCQGGAGIGSLAILDDRAGDDRYVLGPQQNSRLLDLLEVFPTGQGGAYGPAAPPGAGVAIFRDRAGDDAYDAVELAQGHATLGLAAFQDDGGRDAYGIAGHEDGAAWAGGFAGVGRDR